MSKQSVTGDGGLEPATVSSLADDLKALGVRCGDTVMVHRCDRSVTSSARPGLSWMPCGSRSGRLALW